MKVLSTRVLTLYFFANFTTAQISVILSIGFVGLSSQINHGLNSLILTSRALRSVISMNSKL